MSEKMTIEVIDKDPVDAETESASSLDPKAVAASSGGPARIAPESRRRYPRVACLTSALASVNTWKGRRSFEGIIHDASKKGVRVEFQKDLLLNVGDHISLRWKIPQSVSLSNTTHDCTLNGIIVRARDNAQDPNVYGVRFDRLIDEEITTRAVRLQKAAIFCIGLLMAADIVFLKVRNLQWFWYSPIFQCYSVIVSAYIFLKVLVSLFYREPKDNGVTPSATIVVAVKNEELHIAETVARCFDSRYPSDQLEVLVVDDGSTDKTWDVLSTIQDKYPKLTIHKFPTNRGKRHAMAYGAEQAQGEILIFIDSDSFIEPESVYKLVQPFHNKRIGAVAGHCQVIVQPHNMISKMEAVRYYISNRVMKAAESVFGSVTCCPGPFSAYRKDIVLNVLPRWENQMFLGVRSTFGDDRSLTNFVLRTHEVVFHAGAIVRTYVPETWKIFFKQQLRWKKSWARETVIAAQFMWRMHVLAAIPYYAGVLLTLLSPIVALHALLYLPVFMSMNSLPYLAGLVMINIFFSCMYYYFTRSRYWYYSLAFGFLYLAVLCWQTYYAMLTVSKTQWGTR
jgi:hyaluronan synthase